MPNPPRILLDYRPVRIGWVIPNQDVARLLTAVTWNTCLWGGRHNCIVPAHDTALAGRLVSYFRVDVLLPVQPDAETTAFIERFPHLAHHRWRDSIFQRRQANLPIYDTRCVVSSRTRPATQAPALPSLFGRTATPFTRGSCFMSGATPRPIATSPTTKAESNTTSIHRKLPSRPPTKFL
jgi:hypothetical protein